MIRRQYVDGASYPPALTGLRGSHVGSFDVGHEIRDGRRFDVAPAELAAVPLGPGASAAKAEAL